MAEMAMARERSAGEPMAGAHLTRGRQGKGRSGRLATITFLAGILLLPSPTLALDARPYLRVGAEAAYESNVTGRSSVSEEPYRSFYSRGPSDVLGLGMVDGGFDLALDDRFGLYAGLGARAIGYANYPTFSHVVGSGVLELSAVDLPGDFDAALAWGYRDDFLGGRGQWASATLERPLPWAIAGYASTGYDWSAATDPRAARQGPFFDVGLRRRFLELGTSLRAALGAARPTYGSGRTDMVLTASAGLAQRLGRGVYATLRLRLDLLDSSEPGRSLSAPAVSLGSAWILP